MDTTVIVGGVEETSVFFSSPIEILLTFRESDRSPNTELGSSIAQRS
jgi:hypothetical protein